MAENAAKPFCALDALNELNIYFHEMVSLKKRQLDTVSSAPGEANMLDGEASAYAHAQEMVSSYITRLDLIAKSLSK